MAARPREARSRPRAPRRAVARRGGRARARQRPLPDELLGHEGLRRLRVPARGRAGPDLPRGVRRGRRADGVDGRRASRTRLRRARPAPTASAHARAGGRRGEAPTAASASSSRWARRPPIAWSASRRRSRRRWFDAFPDAVDATPLLVQARAVKTEQEVERMRIANADRSRRDGACARAARGRDEGVGGGGDLAGIRPRAGHRARPTSSSRCRSRSIWAGRGIKTFTATGDLPVTRGRAGAVRDLGLRGRLLGRSHEEPRRRRAARRLSRARARARRGLRPRGRALRARSEPRRARPARPRGDRRARAIRGSPPIRSATGSARGRTSRPTRTRREAVRSTEGMVLAIEPGCYWEGGGGLRVEDNFLITTGGAEKLSAFPDGVVRCRT